jgi:hypothetical protein
MKRNPSNHTSHFTARSSPKVKVIVLPMGDEMTNGFADGEHTPVGKLTNHALWRSIPIFLCVCLIALLSLHISAPWQFVHDDNGAWFSATARTHLMRGLVDTKGQDFFLVRETGEMSPYLHHPPFVSLFLAAVFAGTGLDTPLVARSAVAVLHIVAFLVFLRIANMMLRDDILSKEWSAFVFAIVPMSTFFGKMPNHEVPGLLFFEVGVLVSLCATSRGALRRGNLGLLFLAWFLVPFTSWHASLSALAFVLCFGATMRRDIRLPFLLVACSALVVSLVLVVLQLLWANDWQSLPSQHTSLSHWLAAPDGKGYLRFWVENIECGAKHGRRFYSNIPWLLSIGWVLWLGIRAIKRRPPVAIEYGVLFLGAGSLLYCVVFARAIRIHAYQQFYFIPFVALSSALVVSRLYNRVLRFGRSWAILLVVVLGVGTVGYSLKYLYRLYREPGDYAVKASRSIEQQCY